MNPYTPEAAQQKYPGAPQNQPRYPWRASGKSQPKPQQNTGGQQEAAPGPQKAPDMSMYSPGQAKPIQPQSQGTPYGAQSDGNYAYATPNNRPAPFTQRYTNFDGTQSEQPNFGQRDAFIQNINDSMLPYYGGKAQGAPQFDFQSMYKKADDMVKDGWQNPFLMPARHGATGPSPAHRPSLDQQLAQYAPQTQYQPEVSRQSIYAPVPITPEQQRAIPGDGAWEVDSTSRYSAGRHLSPFPVDLAYSSPPSQYQPQPPATSPSAPQQLFPGMPEIDNFVSVDAYAPPGTPDNKLWHWSKGRDPRDQPQYQPADPVRYDTGPYDPNGGRVIGGDRLPVVGPQPPSTPAAPAAPQPQYQGGDWWAYAKSGGSASPVSPTADPYAQFRQYDPGELYLPAASPPAFDPLYGHGTTAAWEAAGAPKSAPQFAGIFAKGYTPQPGETDVIQPGTYRR